MCKFVTLLVIYLVSEVILAFIFSAIAQLYYKEIANKGKGIDFKSVLKGIFERVFLAVSLINNLPHALTFFSALKLATRLKHDEPDKEHNKFNDYYLVGNLASVLVAIIYSWLYLNFDTIELFRRICG